MRLSVGGVLREQWLSLGELLRQRREQWRKLLEQVRVWVRELVDELGRRGIRVVEVFVFGSIARGDFSCSSDLDLVVVSPDWGGIDYVDRLSLLYRLWDKPIDANFVPLTPEELARRLEVSVVLRDASRYWVRIYLETV